MKLLSVDPANYPDAPREGIRRILEQETGIPHPRGAPLDTSRIASIRMGTTVATNALLERAGERCALAITAGFSDLLHIGNQARPSIFDLAVRCPGVLHEAVVEVEESVVLPLGDVPGGRAGADPVSDAAAYAPAGTDAVAVTGEAVRVEKAPDLDRVAADLRRLLDAGFRSLAVVFKHAATFPDHERAVGALARQLGFTQVSLSSDVSPVVKMVPRGFTATADAYLTPHIARYIAAFQSGFDAGLVGGGGGDGDGGGGGGGETSPSSSSSSSSGRLAFMQSDGALAPVSAFSGHRAILSGPAGGYVGYARTTRWGADAGSGGTDGNGGGGGGTGGGGTGGNHASPVVVPPQIIGFDMGGTSTDVSRFAGAFEHVHECTTAGVTIQAPQLDINTVAAGGGSRLFYRHGLVEVGPESAGAHPGPLCYRKGGHAAVTDANLVLGRIVPAFFPSIFGPGEDAPLDAAAAEAGLRALAEEVNADARAAGQPEKTVDEVRDGRWMGGWGMGVGGGWLP
jgi:5-oxoprolinase (ATP-hydrolysing)